jgi:hypothetical protein
MNYDVAARLVPDLHEVRARLNDALIVIEKNCDEDEFKRYRKAFGGVMGELFLEVLTPIYREHPSLTPPELHRKRVGQ